MSDSSGAAPEGAASSDGILAEGNLGGILSDSLGEEAEVAFSAVMVIDTSGDEVSVPLPQSGTISQHLSGGATLTIDANFEFSLSIPQEMLAGQDAPSLFSAYASDLLGREYVVTFSLNTDGHVFWEILDLHLYPTFDADLIDDQSVIDGPDAVAGPDPGWLRNAPASADDASGGGDRKRGDQNASELGVLWPSVGLAGEPTFRLLVENSEQGDLSAQLLGNIFYKDANDGIRADFTKMTVLSVAGAMKVMSPTADDPENYFFYFPTGEELGGRLVVWKNGDYAHILPVSEGPSEPETVPGSGDDVILDQTIDITFIDAEGSLIVRALNFFVGDNAPTWETSQAVVLPNDPGYSVTGDIVVNYEDDPPNFIGFSNLEDQDSGRTSGGEPLMYRTGTSQNVLEAYTSVGEVETVIFTVTADAADGSYTVTTSGEIDAPALTYGEQLATVHPANWGPSASFDLGGLLATFQDINGVKNINTSRNGMGLANNLINGSEVLQVTFTDAGTDTPTPVNNMTVTVQKLSSGDTMHWEAYAGGALAQQGDVTPPSGIHENDTYEFTIPEIAGGYDEVHFGVVSGDYRLFSLTGEAVELRGDTTLTLDTVEAVDADGNTTSGILTITFAGDGLLTGSDGNEILIGRASDDFIKGGGGDDDLYGGGGSDTFIADSAADGHDTIYDFDLGMFGASDDEIDLSAVFTALGASLGDLTVTENGNDLVLGINKAGAEDFSITLLDVTLSDVGSAGYDENDPTTWDFVQTEPDGG